MVLVGAGLGTVGAERAVAAPTSSVGNTRVGILAYAGNDPVGDFNEVDHDGNSSVTLADSDTGPDGSASGTVTVSSTASTTEVTVSGTASTTQSAGASVSVYPTSIYLDTVLGESGYWAWEGSFQTTSSDTAHDDCITGSIRLKIYPPGEDDNADYNELAQVTRCTNGSGHQEFGDIDAAGIALAAGSKLEITGNLTSSGGTAGATDSASFSLDVSKKPGTPPPPPPPVTGAGAPVVTGTGVVGTVLSSGTGTWNGAPTSFTYRWRSGGVNVSGATGSTYTVRAADVGQLIVCRVTAYNATSSGTQDSQGILGVAGTPPPETPTTPDTPAPPAPTALANTAPPTVAGKYVVGKKLTASAGTWSQLPTSTTYQWLRNGVPIKGATGVRYKLIKKDKGKKVSVMVTAKAPGFLDGTSTSAAKKVKPKPNRPKSQLTLPSQGQLSPMS